VIYTNPGFPIYESMINYMGRQGCSHPTPRGARIHAGRERSARADYRPHQASQSILRRKPHRRRHVAKGHRAGGQNHRRPQYPRALGRNLQPFALEGEHFSISSIPGMRGAHHHSRWLLQDYAMTGWRMGYGVMRPDLATHMTRLMTNPTPAPPALPRLRHRGVARRSERAVTHMCAEFKSAVNFSRRTETRSRALSCRQPKARSTSSQHHQKGWKSKPRG